MSIYVCDKSRLSHCVQSECYVTFTQHEVGASGLDFGGHGERV
jgi:hypothetical protein